MTDSITEPITEQPKRSSRRRQVPPLSPEAPEVVEPPASPSSALQTDAGEAPTIPAVPIAGVDLALPGTAQTIVHDRTVPIPLMIPAPMGPGMQPGSALGPPPAPEPIIAGSPFRRHDVVQILDPESRHYGGVLIVGDVLRDKVHGYFFTEGRHRDYITINIKYCWYLGTSRARAMNACSPKWIADNRPA